MMNKVVARRVFFFVGITAVIGALRFSRIFQVAAFALAAGIRRLGTPSAMAHPDQHADEWKGLERPGTVQHNTSRVAITYHPWYQHYRPPTVSACLAQCAALGASYLRSDVRWKDVMPDATTPDEDAFKWYRAYFLAARDWYGMQPLIVLSEPPKAVGRFTGIARMKVWKEYLEQVMVHLGDLCDIYQVMNEPNNPVYRFFPLTDLAEAVMVASSVIKQRAPHAKLVVNVLLDLANWKTVLIQLLSDSGRAVDIIALDYYPGTWSLGLGSDWSQVMDLAVEIRNGTRGSVWEGRTLAIMETGYATNFGRTQCDQVLYYQSIQDMACSLDRALNPGNLQILGLYELCDDDTSVFLDPEAHFGLLTSKLVRKSAFQTVQRLCLLLSSARVYKPITLP